MSTFYLMPPRLLLGDRFADYLKTVFPGLDWSRSSPFELAELLTTAVARHPDVYVIYREELAEGEATDTALQNGFGAEAGDEVIEIRPGARPGDLTARRWRVEPSLQGSS